MKKIVLLSLVGVCLLNADVGIIERITDGDTIRFTDNKVCRLAYIDTPESMMNERLLKKVSKCDGAFAVKDYLMIESGIKAKEFLSSKIKSGDTLNYKKISTDRYKRNICEIFLPNGVDLSLLMVAKGYAVPYLAYIKDSEVKSKYLYFNNHAKKSKLGIYSSDFSTMECLSSTN